MGLLTKDWWNVKGSVKRLRPGDVNPRPFKPANPSPFRDLVFLGGLKPMYIRIDPAHTFAIDGIGKNYYASGLVLLVMMGWWGEGTTEDRFKNAYSRFMSYVDAFGKSTSIHEFSYKTLKLPVGSLPVCTSTLNLWCPVFPCFSPSFMFINFNIMVINQPRLRAQPHGLGKGHDAAVVGAWLGQELGQIDVASVVTCMF